MHSTFGFFTKWNWSRIYWSCIFPSCRFLPWKFGPSFSSRVGRFLIYLVPHWSLIFRPAFSVDPASAPPYRLAVVGWRDGNKGRKGENGREDTATKLTGRSTQLSAVMVQHCASILAELFSRLYLSLLLQISASHALSPLNIHDCQQNKSGLS